MRSRVVLITHVRSASALLCSALFATGCVGDLGAGPSRPRGTPDPGGGLPPGAPEVPAARLVLLTPRHYAHTIDDLLGVEVVPPASAGGDPTTFNSAFTDRMTEPLAFELAGLAERIAREADVVAIADCDGLDDEACVTRLVARLGRRAFRRPPTPEEADALSALAAAEIAIEGREAGLRLVVEAMLQSPSFLYRRELGRSSGGGLRRLDGYEVASAISYLLLDSTPDDALLDAAAAGELDTAEGVARTAERLLDTPEVRARLGEMVLRFLDAGAIESTVRNDPALTPALRTSMATETRLVVAYVLGEGTGTLAELLVSRHTFVDPALAALYGVPYPASASGFVRVELPSDARAGVLTHASWLTTHADLAETSVIKRGLFVARRLLCRELHPPDASIIEAARDELTALPTERARAEFRIANPVCGGCHAQIDAFGVPFERWDELGRARESAHGVPIDSTWDIGAPDGVRGVVADGVELSDALAGAPEVARCVAAQMAGQALGRPLTTREASGVVPLGDAFATSGLDLIALFQSIATSHLVTVRRETP